MEDENGPRLRGELLSVFGTISMLTHGVLHRIEWLSSRFVILSLIGIR